MTLINSEHLATEKNSSKSYNLFLRGQMAQFQTTFWRNLDSMHFCEGFATRAVMIGFQLRGFCCIFLLYKVAYFFVVCSCIFFSGRFALKKLLYERFVFVQETRGKKILEMNVSFKKNMTDNVFWWNQWQETWEFMLRTQYLGYLFNLLQQFFEFFSCSVKMIYSLVYFALLLFNLNTKDLIWTDINIYTKFNFNSIRFIVWYSNYCFECSSPVQYCFLCRCCY